MLIRLLLIVHFLVDFYLHNDSKVEKKGNEKLLVKRFYKTEMFKHSFVYLFLSSSTVFILYESDTIGDYLVVVSLFLTHGVIDVIKMKLGKRFERIKNHLFFLDQLAHIGVLLLVAYYVDMRFGASMEIGFNKTYVDYMLAILLLSKTGNVVFGVLFERFKPVEHSDEDDGHKNAGGLIGIMERLLIAAFLLTGNGSSIGFVIAAKSVARFNKLSKTQFGEYFLLGTLYSVLYTFLVYGLIFL